MNDRPVGGRIFAATAMACALVVTSERTGAQALAATNASSSYTLLHGSYLIDDCPPCARPTILEPMRGTFELRLVEENTLFSRYELTNIEFTAGSVAGRTYKVVGRGTYSVGGEVALIQNMFLEVFIDDGFTNRLCYLTNATPALSR